MVGVEHICAQVRNHDTVILDGIEGLVILSPDREILGHYQARKQHLEYVGRALHKLGSLPAETQDGYRVRVTANVEFPAELPMRFRQAVRRLKRSLKSGQWGNGHRETASGFVGLFMIYYFYTSL